MTQPRIFIGSSSEGIPLAKAIQSSLAQNYDCEIWSQDIFSFGEGSLENLTEKLVEYDFAILALTPDDVTDSRDEKRGTPRDNVIFELGLFIGGLGRDRAIAIHEQGIDLRLPSDLDGVTVGNFRMQASLNLAASVGPVCSRIENHINKIGVREKRALPNRRVEIVLDKGDTRLLDVAADAVLYLGEPRHKYMAELRRHITAGDPVPMKYLYSTESGSSHWLELCEKESYGFYKHSVRNLSSIKSELVDNIIKKANTSELDFVSLGCGDGKKDLELILEMTSRVAKGQYIHYYPIDISDTLIVEAIRNATGRGVPRNKLRLKAILGDFVDLKRFEIVYEERKQNNIFSLLGNSLGNSDEKSIIDCLANSLYPKDFVLLEVNIGNAETTLNTARDKVNMEHDFSPLSSLGIEYNEALMEYDLVNGISTIDGTSTVRCTYKNAVVGGRSVDGIILSLVHHYNFDKFKAALQKELRVNIVWEQTSGEVALLLVQRP